MSNSPKISDRIPVLMAKLGLAAVSDLEKGPNWDPDDPKSRLISNGLVSDWEDKPVDWSSDKLEKFLNGWNINRVWWRTGEGEVLNEKPTYEQNEPAVTEKPSESWEASAFRKIIEGGAEYVLVPRTTFEGNHRFTSVEQIEIQAKELEYKSREAAAKDEEIRNLTKAFIDLVKEMRGLGSLPETSKVEKTQKDTAV
jgi:hypothetical protein